MKREVILVESPYAGNPDALRYLSCCLLDSVLRGEAPIASHALYPLALPEHVEAYEGKTGREIGLECRDALADAADWCCRLVRQVHGPWRVKVGSNGPHWVLPG